MVGLGLMALLYFGVIRFNYPSKSEYPVRGIDISHHQGIINWEQLKMEDIHFVIIKATEGADYQDPRFAENWRNSHDNGYLTGAYHFYRLCKTGEEQAENFIRTVPNMSDNIAPTIDLEFGGNCETNKTTKQILEEIERFMQILEEHYGKKPIIYVTQEFYDEYLIDQFILNPIWIRNIFFKPELPDDRDWLLWQFANRAHLDGIDMYVDLNVLNGNNLNVLLD